MRVEIHQAEVSWAKAQSPLFLLPELKIESGEKILITGESGKGKTTLLHLLAGLFVAQKGRVELGGTRLDQMSDERRCRFRRENIAMIFQKLNLLEHLTAGENVALGGDGASAEVIGQALKSVGLETARDRRAGVLSLGEQQRVAVARVLCSKAKLILADEPTSSLDARNAKQVIDLLFQAAGKQTLIVVSHDQRLEARFDRHLQFEKLVRA